MRANSETEAALLDVLERFCSGFAGRDADSVVQLFAPDADIVMVTSEEPLLRGPDEVIAFLQRYARGTTTYAWRWDRRDVSNAWRLRGSWQRGWRARRQTTTRSSTGTG